MVTTFRAMRNVMVAVALGALSCGGGDDPPGGGNGDTDGGDTADGTTGNGGTDGHVPNPNNPLIAVIPGMWESYEGNLQTGDGWVEFPPEERRSGPVTVIPYDPNCVYIGPPGDACIDWITPPPNVHPRWRHPPHGLRRHPRAL